MSTAPHAQQKPAQHPAFVQHKHYAGLKKQTDIDELVLEEDYFPVDRLDKNGVYILSPEEEAGIKEALEQVARGEIISNEDLMKEVEEWLKEN